MKNELTEQFQNFQKQYPQIFSAYENLAAACHEKGPLNKETRRLIKLAMAVTIGSEGAVHSNVRRAMAEGLSADMIRHVAILAIPTIGFPKAQAALSWIEDILS